MRIFEATLRFSVTAGLGLSLCVAANAQNPAFRMLWGFSGSPDGADPDSVPPLAMGTDGSLYGVTGWGGVYGNGIVFSLTPPAEPGGEWTETVLHSFGAPGDGKNPFSGLLIGYNGDLFGTTSAGGAFGNGTVYCLKRPPPSGVWNEILLYSFGAQPNDGAAPYGTPVYANGVFYGTTTRGGTNICSQGTCGTVFALSFSSSSSTWSESVLHNFGAAGDGAYPGSTLVIGSEGLLYGTTIEGGVGNNGIVFSLAPPQASGDYWREKILLNFGSNGFTSAGLTPGSGPVFYGSTERTVYSLTPPATRGGPWTYTLLWSDSSALIFAGVTLNRTTGVLYGVSFSGGLWGMGFVFALEPPVVPGGTWTETTLYDFDGSVANPVEGLVLGPNGVLYGTTPGTQTAGGSVYALRP